MTKIVNNFGCDIDGEFCHCDDYRHNFDDKHYQAYRKIYHGKLGFVIIITG